MEAEERQKLAWKNYLFSKELEKRAGKVDTVLGLGRTAAKAFGNRFGDSARNFKPLMQHATGFFSKNPNAVSQARATAKNVQDVGGGVGRVFKPSMSSSRWHAREGLNMSDEALKSVNTHRIGGKRFGFNVRNPLHMFNNRTARWYSKLDDAGKAYYDQLRRATAGGAIPREAATKQFMRRQFGGNMNPTQFNSAYQRHGSVVGDGSRAAYLASNIGRQAGGLAGAAAITAPLVYAPMTLGKYTGAGVAGLGAEDRATDAANRGAADWLYQYNQQGMMNRLGGAIMPSRGIEQMYQDDPYRAGVAHSYMYGDGRNAQVESPGMSGYIRDLLFPVLPGLSVDDPVAGSAQGAALRNFQKAGFVKEAGGKNPLPWLRKTFGKQPIPFKAAPVPKPSFGGMPAIPNLAAKAKPPTPRFDKLPALPPDPGRFQNAVNQAKKNKMLVGGGALFTGMGYLGGRSTVNNAADNAGYGAGYAGAAQGFANLPWYQRLGAAAMPQAALNKIQQMYPQIHDAYINKALQYANYQPPAGMR